MPSSAPLRVLLLAAGLLAASLGLKAAVLASPDPVVDDVRLLKSMTSGLQARGYVTSIDPRNFVVASKGSCRLKARDYPPTGALERAFADLGADFGATRFAYRNDWHASPPTYLAVWLYYAQREISRAGLQVPTPAIIAVSATPSCWAEPPEWADVPRWLRIPR